MYKIPNDEMIVLAIRDVIVRHRTVHSQKKLKELVEEELENTHDDDYRVSGERARRLAIHSGLIRIDIHCKEMESDEDEVYTGHCPVCGDILHSSKNMTIFGGTVILGHQCETCSYWTGMKKRVPTRYIFHKK